MSAHIDRPEGGQLGRRGFLAGAGGVVAAPMIAKSATAAPGIAAPAEPLTPAELDSMVVGQQEPPAWTCDLTRRWLHVDPSVTVAGLLAAWPCDEGSGYAFADVTANGHTLHVTGSRWNSTDSGLVSAFRRAGRRGGGVHLDGTRWLAARPAAALDVGQRISVSAWVRRTAAAEQEAVLLSHPNGYTLAVTTAGTVRWTVYDANGRTRTATSAAAAVPAGRWVHVAATADAELGRLVVYVSGSRPKVAEDRPFTVAAPGSGLVAGRHLVGDLDELTLHDRVLTPAAVGRLYVVGLPTLYSQTRVTIDAARQEWSRFAGSDPVPHPVESATVFSVRFDDSATSDQGAEPLSGTPSYQPAWFSGGLVGGAGALSYPSPLPGPDGTFEAWYVPTESGARSGELFRVTGGDRWLALSLDGDRWQARLGHGGTTTHTVDGPRQRLVVPALEHVAVTWGDHGGRRAIGLQVNGVEVGRTAIGSAGTTFDQRVLVGAATGLLVDDVRISRRALAWGETCPRGHARTDAAGIDLRDGFDRPDGTAPRWWRPGGDGPAWTQRSRVWEDVTASGDDPDRSRALLSPDGGLRTLFHPDAFGHASSIEAGVAFDALSDGWAGVFVQASGPNEPFAGYAFAVNPGRNALRIARYEGAAVAEQKTLPYDFRLRARATYTLTLTAANDGLLRGFVDGHNLISWRTGDDPPTSGHAGLLADGAAAYFDDVHVSPLTPAGAESRQVQARLLTIGDVAQRNLGALPFRWHKRRGLLPWEYESGTKNPEPPGNLAGAATHYPARPIPPAFWRSEDSANPDLAQIDGRLILFERGNPRVGVRSIGGRIGVLDTTSAAFDGIHFDDPSRGRSLDDAKLLKGRVDTTPLKHQYRFQVNDSAAAYVGDGRLLVILKETRNNTVSGQKKYAKLVCGSYDVRADDWVSGEVGDVPWSTMAADDPQAEFRGLMATPELVALRDPDDDVHRLLLFHQNGNDDNPGGRAEMGITGLELDADGVPVLDPDRPTVSSISRASGKVIYSFRILFDNGIYFLHYAEGPNVPDWPDHMVLAAALDPYAGPWVVNPATDALTYFTRGSELEPDNAAIWQADMVKHRGRYHLYYENYHSINNVDPPQYPNYNHPQAGSRLGYATA